MLRKKKNTKGQAGGTEELPKEDLPTDLSVGEILRRARVSSNQSLEDVEKMIRIRVSLLQAIEDMDLERLPGWIYTLGFVKTYSDYLDLDSAKMLALLKAQVGDRKRQALNFPAIVNESALPDIWVMVSAGVGILVLIALAFIIHDATNQSSRHVNDIPPVPQGEQKVMPKPKAAPEQTAEEKIPKEAAESEEEAPWLMAPRDENGIVLPLPRQDKNPIQDEGSSIEEEEVADSSTSGTPAADYRVVLHVLNESWVEIRDQDGKIIVSKTLKQGDDYFVPAEATGFWMTIGNMGGIEIIVDGKKLETKGQQGEIRGKIPLDPESLKEMFS